MAIVSPEEIDPTPVNDKEPINWLLFFPEALIAGGLVLAAPFLAIKLAYQGSLLVAISMFFGIWGFGYLCYIGFRDGKNWLSYIAIVGILLAGSLALF